MNSYWIILLIPVFYITGWILWYRYTGGPPRGKPKIISFHKISSKPELGGTFLFPSQFEKFMKYIAVNGFETVSIDRLLSSENEKHIAIFFDDAYSSVYEKAFPVMKHYGLTGVIAPIAGYIGKDNAWDRGVLAFPHMTSSEIAQMSEYGFDVISHTMSHSDLRKLSDTALFNELRESKKMLAGITGKDINYLLYPYGLYNRRVQRAVMQCGYKGAFASYARRNDTLDPYGMGRNSLYIIDSVLDLRIILNRGPLLLYGHEEAKGRIINWFARFAGVIRL